MKYTHCSFLFGALLCISILSGCSSQSVNQQAPSSNAMRNDIAANQQASNISNYTTNQACINMLKESEALRLKAYRGPGVGNPWLIGYGHKATATEGMVINEKQAERLLKQDLLLVESAIKRMVKVELTENQFSAISCFAYNMGTGNLAKSTLLKLVNNRDFTNAAEEFGKWRRIGPNISQHLVKRRAKEKALFLL